jgi:hypothetical protein
MYPPYYTPKASASRMFWTYSASHTVPCVHLAKVLEGSRPVALTRTGIRTNSTASSGRIQAHIHIMIAPVSFSYLHVVSIPRACMGLQHVYLLASCFPLLMYM